MAKRRSDAAGGCEAAFFEILLLPLLGAPLATFEKVLALEETYYSTGGGFGCMRIIKTS